MKSRGAAVTLAVVLAVAATGAIYLYVQGVRGAQAGDHVTMYASFSDVSVLTNNLKDLIAGKGTPTKLELGGITATVVPDVRILMVAGLAPGNGITGGGGGNGGVRVTFELTPSDA